MRAPAALDESGRPHRLLAVSSRRQYLGRSLATVRKPVRRVEWSRLFTFMLRFVVRFPVSSQDHRLGFCRHHLLLV